MPYPKRTTDDIPSWWLSPTTLLVFVTAIVIGYLVAY